MQKEEALRCLIIEYLGTCCAMDENHREEFESSIETLKEIWKIDSNEATIPGIRTILDLIPRPSHDQDMALRLKSSGNEAFSSGDFETAIHRYSEAIDCDPTQSRLYCNRAAAYSKINEHEKAVADSRKAISLDPMNPVAYSRLGYALWSLNKISEARDAYRMGLILNPNDPSLKESLDSLGMEPEPSGTFLEKPRDFLQNLFESFSNGPAMLDQLYSRINSPEVQSLMKDPEISSLLCEIQSNTPSSFLLAGDPRLARLVSAIMGRK